jgi:hypothetical protein
VAAIEIYNKPDFLYREEAFAVLAINGWELLLKAKWLADHGNKVSSLYVMEPRTKKDGSKEQEASDQRRLVRTILSRTASTSSPRSLVDSKAFDANAWANIQALLEMRDSSIHFYNRSGAFPVRLQEIGTASLKNFVAATKNWFGCDMSEFNFYLMPLSFIALPQQTEAVVLNHEEKKFLAFIESLEPANDDAGSPYSVTVNIDIKFTRSKAKDALGVQVTNNPNAHEVRLTEEQIRERYPWDYDRLNKECVKRYSNFKQAQKYHEIRKHLLKDKRFGVIRFLDPGNPKSQKKPLFNPNIMQEFDKYYAKK